jgi:hypothetical protein
MVLTIASSTGQQQRVYYGLDNFPMNHVHSPAETAIARHDDLISVLAALGTNLDLPIKEPSAYANSSSNFSILDWVRMAKLGLSKHIQTTEESLRPPVSDLNVAADWKGRYATLLQEVKTTQHKHMYTSDNLHISLKTLHEMNGIMQYLCELEWLLVARNAQSLADSGQNSYGPHSRMLTVPVLQPFVAPASYVYLTLNGGYNQMWVPKHLTTAYDELFEACFTGDNAKIQQLCFPPDGSTTPPIQISAQTVKPQDRWPSSGRDFRYI